MMTFDDVELAGRLLGLFSVVCVLLVGLYFYGLK